MFNFSTLQSVTFSRYFLLIQQMWEYSHNPIIQLKFGGGGGMDSYSAHYKL
jgi:hypothetical protein